MIQRSHRRRFRNSFSNLIVEIQTVKSRTTPPGPCLWNLFCIKLGYFNLFQIQYKGEDQDKIIRYKGVGSVREAPPKKGGCFNSQKFSPKE